MVFTSTGGNTILRALSTELFPTSARGTATGSLTFFETGTPELVSQVSPLEGLGVGWVSILDPDQLRRDLDVPENWSLVAYLCIGWPQEDTLTPELETVGWELRDARTIDWFER